MLWVQSLARELLHAMGVAKKKKKEGREEARLEMERKMLVEGIPVGVVVKCSGLSAEEISSLE